MKVKGAVFSALPVESSTLSAPVGGRGREGEGVRGGEGGRGEGKEAVGRGGRGEGRMEERQKSLQC